VSQNSSQSVTSEAEQFVSTLPPNLREIILERANLTEPDDAAVPQPSADSASADSAPDESPTPRVSRKEARARLKLRLESIPGFNRHSRKCQICNHPEIEDLEDEYVNWASAHWLAKAFNLSDESTIYRHARATGLDIRRRENLGAALEKIVQKVDHLQGPTVSEVLRAIRILARVNSRGQWVFPPPTEISNRQTSPELEIGLTHTKQMMEVISNRQC